MTVRTPDPAPFERHLETRHRMPWVADCLQARVFIEQLFAHAQDPEWLRGYAAGRPTRRRIDLGGLSPGSPVAP